MNGRRFKQETITAINQSKQNGGCLFCIKCILLIATRILRTARVRAEEPWWLISRLGKALSAIFSFFGWLLGTGLCNKCLVVEDEHDFWRPYLPYQLLECGQGRSHKGCLLSFLSLPIAVVDVGGNSSWVLNSTIDNIVCSFVGWIARSKPKNRC